MIYKIFILYATVHGTDRNSKVWIIMNIYVKKFQVNLLLNYFLQKQSKREKVAHNDVSKVKSKQSKMLLYANLYICNKNDIHIIK